MAEAILLRQGSQTFLGDPCLSFKKNIGSKRSLGSVLWEDYCLQGGDGMKNIGTIDALVRIAAGTLALVRANNPSRAKRAWMLAACGAVLIGEGVTRFSPFFAAVSLTTLEDETAPVRFRLGPILYRRDTARSRGGCTLWGVTQEDGGPDRLRRIKRNGL